MTEEKLKKSTELHQQITALEKLITSLKPLKERSLKETKCLFRSASVNIRIGYTAKSTNPWRGEEFQEEEKTIEIPPAMAEFLYNQYLNLKEGKLHHLKTKFSQL